MITFILPSFWKQYVFHFSPVLIDIPHFASIRGKEREIIILRSDNGETWKEHDNSADNDTTLLNTPYGIFKKFKNVFINMFILYI